MRFKYVLIFLLLVISVALFYWFQWRPSEIRKECYSETYSNELNLSAFGREAIEDQERGLEYKYDNCLLEKGLR